MPSSGVVHRQSAFASSRRYRHHANLRVLPAGIIIEEPRPGNRNIASRHHRKCGIKDYIEETAPNVALVPMEKD